jgi:5-methylcytosine-specific restriction endonuclease McrA
MTENITFSISKTKHSAIFNRAFNSYLDIFLISCYVQDTNLLNSATFDSFKLFNYNNPNIPLALSAYQATSNKVEFHNGTIKDLDDAIDNWHTINKDFSLYKKFFIESRFINIEEFKSFYGPDDNHDRKCHYCKITELDIDRLIKAGKIKTKRLSTRGRSMEVDRIYPNKGYEYGNIVLCCYWCNNAKTDEFTEKDFIPVGKEFEKIWKERLNDNG